MRRRPSRCVAIGPRQSRHGHALSVAIAGVLAEIEIEVLAARVEGGGDVADHAKHEVIARVAGFTTWRRVENDAEILPAGAVVGRSHGAEPRQLPLRPPAQIGRPLVVVVAVPHP